MRRFRVIQMIELRNKNNNRNKLIGIYCRLYTNYSKNLSYAIHPSTPTAPNLIIKNPTRHIVIRNSPANIPTHSNKPNILDIADCHPH